MHKGTFSLRIFDIFPLPHFIFVLYFNLLTCPAAEFFFSALLFSFRCAWEFFFFSGWKFPIKVGAPFSSHPSLIIPCGAGWLAGSLLHLGPGFPSLLSRQVNDPDSGKHAIIYIQRLEKGNVSGDKTVEKRRLEEAPWWGNTEETRKVTG